MSFDDVRALLSAVVIASLLTPVTLFLFFERAKDFPRSAPFLTGIFFLFMLILSRGAGTILPQWRYTIIVSRKRG